MVLKLDMVYTAVGSENKISTTDLALSHQTRISAVLWMSCFTTAVSTPETPLPVKLHFVWYYPQKSYLSPWHFDRGFLPHLYGPANCFPGPGARSLSPVQVQHIFYCWNFHPKTFASLLSLWSCHSVGKPTPRRSGNLLLVPRSLYSCPEIKIIFLMRTDRVNTLQRLDRFVRWQVTRRMVQAFWLLDCSRYNTGGTTSWTIMHRENNSIAAFKAITHYW